jgi:lysophospholipase L1-like esterase
MKEYDLSFITEQDFYGQPVHLRNARTFQMMFPPMLWAIGDSHTQYLEALSLELDGPHLPKLVYRHPFSNSSPTAWKLLDEDSSSRGRQRLFSALRFLRPKDHLILSYGDVDARNQIVKRHINDNVTLDVCVDETVERYGKVLAQIRELGFGSRIIVHGTPPLSQWLLGRSRLGEREVRIESCRLFNERLRKHCEAEKFLFFDIMQHTGPTGLMDTKWLKDTHHLKPEAAAFFLEWLMREVGAVVEVVEMEVEIRDNVP